MFIEYHAIVVNEIIQYYNTCFSCNEGGKKKLLQGNHQIEFACRHPWKQFSSGVYIYIYVAAVTYLIMRSYHITMNFFGLNLILLRCIYTLKP